MLSDLLCFCFIFGLEWCLALRIMSTVKNTKKVKTFLPFFVLLPYLSSFLCHIYLFDGCIALRSTFLCICFALRFITIKNIKKEFFFFSKIRVLFYVFCLWWMNLFGRWMKCVKNTIKVKGWNFCSSRRSFLFLPYLIIFLCLFFLRRMNIF